MLQSKAGYIDARPLTASSAKPLATHGRTIHWVKSADLSIGPSLPVFPDDRTSSVSVGMSQTCHEQTHAPQQFIRLFDHLVGASKQRGRKTQSNRSRRLEVDPEQELGRQFDRQIGRISALQDFVHESRALASQRSDVS